MKKLLSLLSVLTISGSAIPTTIAVSSYQKQEHLNSYISYIEILNRKKDKIIIKTLMESQKLLLLQLLEFNLRELS